MPNSAGWAALNLLVCAAASQSDGANSIRKPSMFAHCIRWVSLSLVSTTLFTACSPDLNWRVVQGEHANYSVMLPAKPASASKSILLAGQQRLMFMQGAQAAEMQFVIAHVACQREQEASILAAMRLGILKNLATTEAAVQQLEPGIWQIPAPPQQAWASFFASEGQCFQMLILGKAASMSAELRENFFHSFKARTTNAAKP